MKIPYLNKKRRTEMASLSAEFQDAISKNLDPAAVNPRFEAGWLRAIYPLLALLQLLSNSRATLNPSREYALLGARLTGNQELFLRALNSFQGPVEVIDAMQNAYGRTIFSGFISELRSDLLMVMVQGLMYSYRGAGIGLRCALEDLYRHLYYMDHPQEYAARSLGQSEHMMKLSPQFFREYLRRTSYLSRLTDVDLDFSPKSENSMDWFGRNDKLYGDLSAAVHGASDEWFAAVSSAASLQRNISKDDKLDALFEDFAKLCTTFLIAAHRDVFSSAGDYDKSLVLEIYSTKERKNFRCLFNI